MTAILCMIFTATLALLAIEIFDPYPPKEGD